MKKIFTAGFITIFVLCFGITLAPGVAWSDSNPATYTFDITEGNITISPGALPGYVKVAYGNNTPQETTTDFSNTQHQITIIGGTATTPVTNCIEIALNATANITLNGVHIKEIWPGLNALKIYIPFYKPDYKKQYSRSSHL